MRCGRRGCECCTCMACGRPSEYCICDLIARTHFFVDKAIELDDEHSRDYVHLLKEWLEAV